MMTFLGQGSPKANLSNARREAYEAIRLDPRSADPHVSLGFVHLWPILIRPDRKGVSGKPFEWSRIAPMRTPATPTCFRMPDGRMKHAGKFATPAGWTLHRPSSA